MRKSVRLCDACWKVGVTRIAVARFWATSDCGKGNDVCTEHLEAVIALGCEYELFKRPGNMEE
jgi:hypothetical protein